MTLRKGTGSQIDHTERLKMAEDERMLLESLFYKGYEYEEILYMLKNQHNITISLSTLKRKLRQYNLHRNGVEFDLPALRNAIVEILDGPGCSLSYRSVWHALQRKGIRVPRSVVEEIVRELDPDGVEARKAHRLRRRQYICPGPNKVWHADGYDKIKPFGFPIHGCINGYSRKVLWLYVTRSNNLPDNIASYYLDAVREHGGCPLELYTDLGTENGIMAQMTQIPINMSHLPVTNGLRAGGVSSIKTGHLGGYHFSKIWLTQAILIWLILFIRNVYGSALQRFFRWGLIQ